MRHFLILLAAAFSLTSCVPRALYFHESTKVAFAADYNTSDSQPLSTSFGYKRRIVAVVPSQQRNIPKGGTERNATNSGEALSLVSKFNVRAGASDGVTITNNFASGMAARLMTRSAGSPEALNVLLHSAPISVSADSGTTASGKTGSQAVNDRIATTMAKIRRSDVPVPTGGLERDSSGRLIRKSGTPQKTDPEKKNDGAAPKEDVPAPTGGLQRDASGKLIRSGDLPAK